MTEENANQAGKQNEVDANFEEVVAQKEKIGWKPE